MTDCKSCVAHIDCVGIPGCNYPEPHIHGFTCDKTCAYYCHGKGVPVYDPENHPNHKEWQGRPA